MYYRPNEKMTLALLATEAYDAPTAVSSPDTITGLDTVIAELVNENGEIGKYFWVPTCPVVEGQPWYDFCGEEIKKLPFYVAAGEAVCFVLDQENWTLTPVKYDRIKLLDLLQRAMQRDIFHMSEE